MPRKLTILGVLAALVAGIIGLGISPSATATPVQSFCSAGSSTTASTTVNMISASGTATGSTSPPPTTTVSTMTDAGAAWTLNQWAGLVVTMGGSTATITSNTAQILTLTAWAPIGPVTGAYTITGLSFGGTSVTVVSTAGFPATGTFTIGTELIQYGATTPTSFTGLIRGTSPANLDQQNRAVVHANGSTVTWTSHGGCTGGLQAVHSVFCFEDGTTVATTLAANMLLGELSTVTVTTNPITAGFKSTGVITITTAGVPENITYETTSPTEFLKAGLVNLGRGADGTAPAAHFIGDAVTATGAPQGPILAGNIECGPGTSASQILVGTGVPIKSWQVLMIPQGARQTLPAYYLPAPWAFGAAATGATTGNVSANTDLLCNGGIDILSPSQRADFNVNKYPGNGWGTGFNFIRQNVGSAVAGADGVTPGSASGTGSANNYIDSIKPMPASFADVTLDRSNLLLLWLGGATAIVLPPTGTLGGANDGTPLQNLVTLSPYRAGMHVSVALLAGDPSPPTQSFLCLDSPQNSVAQSTTIIPPSTPGSYVRWTVLQSAADTIDGTVSRILDVQCIGVGVVPVCVMTDADGDLVPADVEAANGTNPLVADSDADGASDYDEIFQFTNPADAAPKPIVSSTNASPINVEVTAHGLTTGCGVDITGHLVNTAANGNWVVTVVDANHFTLNGSTGVGVGVATGTANRPLGSSADTDCDGSLDKQDDLAGFNCVAVGSVCTVTNLGDTIADDNCPVDANPAQDNTDSRPDFTNSPNTPAGAIYHGDATNPHQDHQGDVCDADIDNDGLNNVVEVRFQHPNLSPACARDIANTVCVTNPGTPSLSTLYCLSLTTTTDSSGQNLSAVGGSSLTASTSPTNPDSDSDGGLDGRECLFGSDPTNALVGSCQPTCVSTDRYPASVGDTDGDFLSGTILGGGSAAEVFFRTAHINLPGGGTLNDLEQVGSYRPPSPALVCADPNAAVVCDNKVGNADNDADGDLLNDGVEVKWYGTSPANFDTDGDGCSDGREAADVNGDHVVNVVDLQAIAAHSSGTLIPGGPATAARPLGSALQLGGPYNRTPPDPLAGVRRGELATYDVNKDGAFNVLDLQLTAKLSGAPDSGKCQSLVLTGLLPQTAKAIVNAANP